ncbi:hypothetical protein AAMO2058_001314800 [Amorphochlora amoebiformis]
MASSTKSSETKSFHLVEIRDRPELAPAIIKLLQDEWPDVGEETRMKAIKRSDGENSFTLALLRAPSRIDMKDSQARVKGGELIAHLRLDAAKLSYKNCKAVLVHSACVKPSLRGQGIGRYLMGQAAKYVSKYGYVYILLKTLKSNRVFYDKCGYQMCPEGNPFFASMDPHSKGHEDKHGALLQDIRNGASLKKASEGKAKKSPGTSIWMFKSVQKKKRKKRNRNKKREGGKMGPEGPGGNEEALEKKLKELAPSFIGLDLENQEIEDLGYDQNLGRITVRAGDRISFVKAYKRSPDDTAEWPNGLHCLQCPLTHTPFSHKTKHSVGVLALHQIVRKTKSNPKKLAVRVMPVLITLEAYEVVRSLVPGGEALGALAKGKPKGYVEAWQASTGFRQYVTDDFLQNYSKRLGKGRDVRRLRDNQGNVLQVSFKDKKEQSKCAEKTKKSNPPQNVDLPNPSESP